MGSSFTYLGKHGFWARDASLELWLFLLAREVGRLPEAPAWLQAAAGAWRLQATAGFTGCVSAELDEHAATPERAAIVLSVSERALQWLRQQGDTLSAAMLNSFGLGGPGSTFLGDPRTEVFTPVGDAFIRLLRRELAWDASTSPLL